MTQTPPGMQPGWAQGPQGPDTFFDTLRRIDMRRSDESWVGGVCAGLAERLGIDPLVIRALFVVLSLGMGIGVVAYLLAWLLIPDHAEEVHLERALRHGEAPSVVLLVFTVLGMFGSFGWLGTWDGYGIWGGNAFWGVLTLIVLGLGAWWLWTEWSRRPEPGYYGRFASTAGTTASTSSTATAPPPPPADSAEWDSGAAEWGSGATAWTPPQTTTAPRAPRTPREPRPPKPPRRPGRRSAGVAGTLLGLGLALAVGGGLYWATGELDWSGNPLVIGVAGALGALGLVILVLGLVGRTSGLPGFLAILSLLATILILPLSEHFVPSGRIGDYAWAPRSASELVDDGPYQVGIGTAQLDLTSLTPGELDGQVIGASVSIGQLEILIPDDLTVQINAGTAIGAVTMQGSPDPSSVGGLDVTSTIVMGGDGPVDLIINADAGVGQILLHEFVTEGQN